MRWSHVVVGAGSAGAVLAVRLSEDPARHVLLLEAGPGDEAPASTTGANFFQAVETPGRTWPALVARRAAGQEPRIYVRGRGLGGSSAVNAMVAIRGLPADYDQWAAMGAAGWGWTDLARWFDRVEVPAEPVGEEALGPVDRALRAAAVALGHPVAPDYDDPGAWGWSPAKLTMRGGRRVSTADAYLTPALGRPNLVVRGDALVDRVAMEHGRVAGVRLAGGEEIEAAEVLVCAGAVHSPAILLRSGVSRPGIGANLKDHPSAPFVLMLSDRARAPDPDVLALASVLRWSSGEADADLQALPMNLLGGTPDVLGMGMVMVALMQVHSSGTVTLASADPYDEPVVDFALLSDERDRRRLRAGVRQVVRLLAQPAFRSICEAVAIDATGTPPEALGTDDEVDAWLLANLGDYVHAAGTCRMGDPDDDATVVDPHARVVGVAGLRVVDASVMPDLPRANTHVTTMAVAERVAATIRSGG